ncbi:replication factor C, subunit 1 [Trypanosoma cruzi cruzi]|uniref:Putative replication factor C, subunit 1 n=1 Tax=Trypanosoma cruzi TaxID=5693 RepID=A0A2V2VCV2_TRYCR|nr:replication factor C, subunit 1 [Trypanosoma cruzi cruzi]PWU94054.1 putative replication factor C, subunit 1 [Trypanosoma cruzi]
MVAVINAANVGEPWAEKYKPKTIAQMCYPSSANKLKAWIETFDSGSSRMRAALLSGPPGVGKTTSVYVVARELGRIVVEYNASHFRSGKSLREHVTVSINNNTFNMNASSYAKSILLMDEVDGCDIGGVKEIIEMTKTTKTPIVCTCNDRWNQKLRPLLNYVEDFRVSRPPCNIVANYLCDKVLAREGISLSKQLLQDIIQRSGSDIRSMLNNLQMWCLNRTSLEQKALAACAVQSAKDEDVGLFDAAEMFLLQGTSRGKPRSIEELQTAFYNSDLVDLFVQENYIHFNPEDRDWMEAVADAADSISLADALQRIMYYEQNWSVSRAHVQLSSIAPCAITRGHYESFLSGQQVFFDRQRPVKFPTWLGQNSSANKNKRIIRCLTLQALSPSTGGISGNQEDVLLDYIPLGWEAALTQPLVERGKAAVDDVIRFMDQYHIMRDDWEFIQTVPHFKTMRTSNDNVATGNIPAAVKSAFTREFNKTHRTESFVKGALQLMGGVETQSEWAEEDTEKENGGNELLKTNAGAKKTAAAKKTAKKEPASKPKAKKPSLKTKKTAKKRGRKATPSDSEEEFTGDSSDDD